VETQQGAGKLTEKSNGKLRRELSAWTRWLHIYLSMFSFVILFFFALTGLTLNHTEWFASQQKSFTEKGAIDTVLMNTNDTQEVRRLEIVEFLRKTHGLKGALSDFIADENQLTIAFSGPAYSADIFIERETGAYEVTITQSGFFALINDLHKGRDSGKGWSILIDISAILMILVSITGLIMMFFLKKKRLAGFIIALIGAVLSYLVYIIWVP
jgi:uncharacterized protein